MIAKRIISVEIDDLGNELTYSIKVGVSNSQVHDGKEVVHESSSMPFYYEDDKRGQVISEVVAEVVDELTNSENWGFHYLNVMPFIKEQTNKLASTK